MIYGPPGTGKTMLASAVFNEIAGSVPARTSIDDAQQAGTADNVVWLNSAELVKRFRRDDHDSVTPAQKWHHAATAFMAVLDDLDKHPAGEWGNDLLALVDARVWRQRFPTIITMNLDPPALARRYGQAGAPIVDRLNRSGAMWIRLDERPKPS